MITEGVEFSRLDVAATVLFPRYETLLIDDVGENKQGTLLWLQHTSESAASGSNNRTLRYCTRRGSSGERELRRC